MSSSFISRAQLYWTVFQQDLKSPNTAIAIGLFVLATLVTLLISQIYFNKSLTKGRISIWVEQIRVFDRNPVGDIGIELRDRSGKPINENIYAANVWIWNSGNSEIKKQDIREPLVISVQGSKILDMTNIYFSNNNIDQFHMDHQTISWENFDPNEGLKIRIIYAAPVMLAVRLRGYVANIDEVNKTVMTSIDQIAQSTVASTRTLWSLRVQRYGSIVLACLLIYFVVTSLRRRWLWFIMGALVGLSIVVSFYAFTSQSEDFLKPPF